MIPEEVEMMAMPIPPSTLGSWVRRVWTRPPGRDTRRIPEMLRVRLGPYFSRTWRVGWPPGPAVVW